MLVSATTLDLLTLLRLPGIGPRGAIRLGKGDLSELRSSPDWDVARSDAEATIQVCAELGIGVVGWFDDQFPERIRGIPEPTAILFYRGDIEVTERGDAVAIVGTREPTSWGIRASRTVADSFASKGWTIVSGLALGIDTEAHRVALAHGTPTIAVLGNGLASVYPTANRGLADEIVKASGLLLAEVAPQAGADARSLVKRDRLQSGLASVTVVCQGGRKSGAMHTARYAFEQQRPLYCAAFSREGESLGIQDEGTLALISEPARRLPELLPAWRRVPARRLGDSAVAVALDEATLDNVVISQPSDSTPRLF